MMQRDQENMSVCSSCVDMLVENKGLKVSYS